MTVVREAVPEDAEGLAPILEMLGYPAGLDTIRERLRRLKEDDPSGRVLVAVDGEIVGFLTAHATPTLHRETLVGRITGLAVREGARRQGAARLLVEAAEAHFRSLGLNRMEVTSGPAHEPAHGFYRHLGYRDEGIRFSKPLRRDPGGGAC